MARKLLYLAYYLKEIEWAKLMKFMRYASVKHGTSLPRLWFDMLQCSMRYNISLLEYFNFRFYELDPEQRLTYAGTGFMYEYQLKMNPKHSRVVLSDKIRFLQEYQQFVRHNHLSLEELESNPEKAQKLLVHSPGKVVLKRADGQCGRGIRVIGTKGLSAKSLIEQLKSTGNNLVEEFVVQHDALMTLSPAGLNTVRLITQLDEEDEVNLIGARLRITINSSVDNLAAGNIAAPIDMDTGIVQAPGVYSDITKPDETIHPLTGISIVGFQVPFWQETISMIKHAALLNTSNRSIGWDIAITNDGPELIEGNHDWCKLLWQLPVKTGLRPVLERYLSTIPSSKL